ncbi:molybdopterin-dependent oxidoreductase [Azospirillum picis]|uniref:Oxidoreductase molybdopterin-binding domain-containing protein n=1 Tax=Azospirillum picis TaxID=488438 RepID=A0ABU0MJ59_9PROT|nr:molybdopterin-dependent oxidoreductase [Azospirillum picis]MBP2299672.1 hypothetical protein [Azospirillum picis]MDQ0533468.1 hypothetical protein [Azospirillum picis]
MTYKEFCCCLAEIFLSVVRSIVPLVLLTLFVASPALADDADKVILTVAGKADRPARFTLADLDALPQAEIRTSTPWHDGVKRFTGPSLAELLRKVGATGSELAVTALNDYSVRLPASDAAESGPILATRIDGQPIAVRAKGPIFIIYPFDAKPQLRIETIYNRSVWQVKQIDVQ